jgi:uncharacterized membrane protein YsdA (DUF1294 family)
MRFAWILAMSVAAFCLCGLDKAHALNRTRRVPERVLLLVALLGGTPGLVVGMLLFQHKIRSPLFIVSVVAVISFQMFLASST